MRADHVFTDPGRGPSMFCLKCLAARTSKHNALATTQGPCRTSRILAGSFELRCRWSPRNQEPANRTEHVVGRGRGFSGSPASWHAADGLIDCELKSASENGMVFTKAETCTIQMTCQVIQSVLINQLYMHAVEIQNRVNTDWP